MDVESVVDAGRLLREPPGTPPGLRARLGSSHSRLSWRPPHCPQVAAPAAGGIPSCWGRCGTPLALRCGRAGRPREHPLEEASSTTPPWSRMLGVRSPSTPARQACLADGQQIERLAVASGRGTRRPARRLAGPGTRSRWRSINRARIDIVSRRAPAGGGSTACCRHRSRHRTTLGSVRGDRLRVLPAAGVGGAAGIGTMARSHSLPPRAASGMEPLVEVLL